MMTYEVRIIYKDGTCAVFSNIRKIEVYYEEFLLYKADINQLPILIKEKNMMKAIKIAIKEW